MNCFFDRRTVALSNQEGRDADGATLAIILHGGSLNIILVHNDGHDGAKLLYILYFLDEVAVTSVNHDDIPVAIKTGLLEMILLKVRLVERIAAILVRERVVHTTLEHSVFFEGAEAT